MLTIVPVPDQILESPQFSTCTELPILHQMHGGLPLPLSHSAVVEVLKLCANAGPLGRSEVEEWKSAVLGLSSASSSPETLAPLIKPMAAFSLNPVTTMPPLSVAPVTSAPEPITPPEVAPVATVPSAGVPKGAMSPLVMGGVAGFSPVRPPAPILKPTMLPPLPSPTVQSSPVRSVHFDLEDDLELDEHHHPRVPAHLSHTPPPSARQSEFDHSHLTGDYFSSRFEMSMDDYGSEPASQSMSPAIPVLELGPRATQSSLGGFIPLSCAPEVDPGMARKLAQKARDRELREREEREEKERIAKLEVESKNPRDVMVDALMAAHMNRARHAAGIPLLPVLPTLPAPPLVALTSASQIRTLSPADADAWAHYYLGAECDPARAPDAILAAVGVL
ncbi:hypothetical protein A1Q2_04739 [Trichosporon asahii var. asahii CBS 8904]|uniref:Uncharacterized protein n=1 Tax=Trichosporon asahii var. asahii (strain CBS 8904) TaxID=1220162 RepID=K1VNC4_TRIAC|nr:hypothetical protein A1Q2_04739 [Trichosporon asahii var. asahii CBS 8904]